MGIRRFKVGYIVLAILTISNFCPAKYSGGDGSTNNPYQIANASDLLLLSADANDYNDSFILVNNINLAGYTFDKAVIAPGDVNIYTGFLIAFTGIFDGNGFTIRNFKYESKYEVVGLFGYIENATIKNLRVEDINISGDGYMVGGICGSNLNSNIFDCYLTGSINGYSLIGGICGYNDSGMIKNCHSYCDVNGYGQDIGGLVGSAYAGNIIDCCSAGKIDGTAGIGGLVGANVKNNIINSYATGDVNGTSQMIGGLAGLNTGSIFDCFATGNVSSNCNYYGFVGGLTGYNYDGGIIKNCHSTGAVKGYSIIGGLVGENFGGFIEDCYSICDVNSTAQQYSSVGGLAGVNSNSGRINNCHSVCSVIGSSEVGGLVGIMPAISAIVTQNL
jgi:hypothetical protein